MPSQYLAFTAFLLPLLGACAQTPRTGRPDPPEFPAASEAIAALEQRLYDADQFSFTVSVNETTAEEDQITTLSAHFWLSNDNHVRIESAGEVNGLEATPGLVSDGQEMTGGRNGIQSRFADFDRENVPEGLRATLTSSALRWGTYRTLMTLVGGAPPGFHDTDENITPGDPQAHAIVENASWGLPETFDGTAVRPLSFRLPYPAALEVAVTLWLGIETGLPVRQTVRLTFEGSERITEEVYSNWSFETIPSTTFSLPEQP